MQGRRYLDFHGNYVHLGGFANPQVIGAILDDCLSQVEAGPTPHGGQLLATPGRVLYDWKLC